MYTVWSTFSDRAQRRRRSSIQIYICGTQSLSDDGCGMWTDVDSTEVVLQPPSSVVQLFLVECYC